MNGILKRFYLSSAGSITEEEGSSHTTPLTTAESAMLGGAGGFCSATVSARLSLGLYTFTVIVSVVP